MFLQMVVVFGLKSRFDEEYLRKLVMDNATRRDMAKLAVAVGFGQKMEGMLVVVGLLCTSFARCLFR